MANAKTKTRSKKRVAVKDLKAKSARSVKGGASDFTFTKVLDKSSTTLYQK